MSYKEKISITPDTYPFGGDGEMYDYSVHIKSPEHVKRYFKLSPVVDFCRRLALTPQPTTLLDLGSGIGIESNVFKNSLPQVNVISLDISLEGSRKAKLGFNLDQVQADIENSPFGEKVFDGIHCKDVLVHISDKNLFLSGIAQILKPDGLLLLVSSKKASVKYQQFEWTIEQAVGVAEKLGLELISLNVKNLKSEDWYGKPRDRVFLMFNKK